MKNFQTQLNYGERTRSPLLPTTKHPKIMRPSQVINFQQTFNPNLLRPWDKQKSTGILFYGFAKSGSRRHRLTTKQGNKNFYKGTGSSGVGSFTPHGHYIINWKKVQTFVVPENINEYSYLKPLVSSKTPEIKQIYDGYNGPADPVLYFDKVKQYIEFGHNGVEKDVKETGYEQVFSNPRLEEIEVETPEIVFKS